jgi:hypothetical protein
VPGGRSISIRVLERARELPRRGSRESDDAIVELKTSFAQLDARVHGELVEALQLGRTDPGAGGLTRGRAELLSVMLGDEARRGGDAAGAARYARGHTQCQALARCFADRPKRLGLGMRVLSVVVLGVIGCGIPEHTHDFPWPDANESTGSTTKVEEPGDGSESTGAGGNTGDLPGSSGSTNDVSDGTATTGDDSETSSGTDDEPDTCTDQLYAYYQACLILADKSESQAFAAACTEACPPATETCGYIACHYQCTLDVPEDEDVTACKAKYPLCVYAVTSEATLECRRDCQMDAVACYSHLECEHTVCGSAYTECRDGC